MHVLSLFISPDIEDMEENINITQTEMAHHDWKQLSPIITLSNI